LGKEQVERGQDACDISGADAWLLVSICDAWFAVPCGAEACDDVDGVDVDGDGADGDDADGDDGIYHVVCGRGPGQVAAEYMPTSGTFSNEGSNAASRFCRG